MLDDEDELGTLAKRLWAVGDLARLRLLSLLPEQPNCESRSSVSELAAQLGMSQPTISHHLRILRQAGLIDYAKMCTACYYWRDAEAIATLGTDLSRLIKAQKGASLSETSNPE